MLKKLLVLSAFCSLAFCAHAQATDETSVEKQIMNHKEKQPCETCPTSPASPCSCPKKGSLAVSEKSSSETFLAACPGNTCPTTPAVPTKKPVDETTVDDAAPKADVAPQQKTV